MTFTCLMCKNETMLRTKKYKWVEKLQQNICLECLGKPNQKTQKKKFLKDLDNREFDFYWVTAGRL